MMTYSIVITACSHEEEGKTLARKIVENKLAACVQISHIQSTYYWKNAAQNESEYKLMIKTKKKLYKKLEQFIIKNHSYELPQIIQIPIEKGYAPYLDWIEENTLD